VASQPETLSRLQSLIAAAPAALAQAPGIYAEVHDCARAIRVGPLLCLTRYADIKEASTDESRFSADHSRKGTRAEAVRARLSSDEERRAFAEVMEFESHFMNRKDGEDHARTRAVAHRAFTPRRIAELGELMATYADNLIAELVPGEVNDLIHLSRNLPLMVICDLLGVPPVDRPLIKRMSDGIAGNRHGLDLGALVRAHRSWLEFRDYVEALISSHRRSAGSGGELIAALLQSEPEVTDLLGW
jgi:cytochrome P450